MPWSVPMSALFLRRSICPLHAAPSALPGAQIIAQEPPSLLRDNQSADSDTAGLCFTRLPTKVAARVSGSSDKPPASRPLSCMRLSFSAHEAVHLAVAHHSAEIGSLLSLVPRCDMQG